MTYLSLIFVPLISLQEIREVLFGIEKLLFDFFGFFSWVRTSLYLVMFFQVMLIMRYIVACLKFCLSFHSVAINQNIYFEGIYLASSSMGSALFNLVPAITFVAAFVIG